MFKQRKKFQIKWLSLFPLGLTLSWLGSSNPSTVEKMYSTRIYPLLGKPLSLLTGIFPFSLAEILMFFSALSLLGLVIYGCLFLLNHRLRGMAKLFPAFIGFLNILSILYFIFILVWGLNYHRLPFAVITHLDTKPATTEELKELCKVLIDRANILRTQVSEDQKGIMTIVENHQEILLRADKGYVSSKNLIPELKGKYGRPKGVILSELMSYTGISGIYFPFTGEANVNLSIPHAMLPSTITHEMAHQRGFAREDEANYIAYLTCIMHPDQDFQYSGVLLALIHSMNSLYTYDPQGYQELKFTYSQGLRRDLSDLNAFWKRYEGPVERATSKVNDTYLKSNLQEDGVHSYGRMVDLLLAEYKSKKAH